MDTRTVYLDTNATTPLDNEVLESIQGALSTAWGNPSSSYEAGKKAKFLIDEARENVANMIGARASDIVFTSGGTEGNNMIIQTAVKYFYEPECTSRLGHHMKDSKDRLPHFVTSNFEHDSVKLVLEHLIETKQAEVTFVPASKLSGRVEAVDIVSAIQDSTIMVTIMLANNETGIIQPIGDIVERVRAVKRLKDETPRILIHTDAAQVIGKIPVDVQDLDVDYLTVVGHKFYGPRIGAIYVHGLEEKACPLLPMLYGGGQERNFRPGTENTGMIAGLGKAAELVTKHLEQYRWHMKDVREYLEQQIMKTFGEDQVHFNGKYVNSERLPNTCNVSVLGKGLEGYKILSKCKILQASVGAACHSQNRASPILLAIGIPESVAKNALRLSVGRYTTKEDIDCVISDLKQAINTLKS